MVMRTSTAANVRHESAQLSWEALELVADRFRALSEAIRLRILQILQNGETSVSALVEGVGSTQPNISKHLKVLQDVGLVKRRQVGTSAYYSIADEMVFELCEMACSGLRDRLEAQVGALRRPGFSRRSAD
jgi:DNA-binding transcriptional ArsR family regulator